MALTASGSRARGAGGGLARWAHRTTTLGLMLICFSGHWQDLGVPAPLDRLLLASGLVMGVVALARSGGRLVPRPVHVALGAVLAWAALSAIAVGTSQGAGLFALLDRLGVVPYLLFALAPAVYATPESRRFLARAFTVFGLYLALTAIAQMVGAHALVWPGYILDPSIGLHADRARGPYVEGVANGLMLTVSAALAGLTGVADPSPRWRALGWIVVLLGALGVVLTLTRAVWVAAFCAGVAVCVAVRRLRRRAVVGALGLGAVLAVAWLSVPGFFEAASERGADRWPVWDRLNTNWAAVRMVVDNPVTGVGWHQSGERMAEYVRQGASYPVTSASVGLEVHNVYLSRFAELGILGGALWCAAFAAAVVFPLLRRPELGELEPWRGALLVTATVWAVAAMFGPLPYPQPTAVLWTLAGIVLTPYLAAARVVGGRGSTVPAVPAAPAPARTGAP